jgi:hypothetical protein
MTVFPIPCPISAVHAHSERTPAYVKAPFSYDAQHHQ